MLHLNDLRGQNTAKRLLEIYLRAYPPGLFIFHGPSGVGKCSAAEGFIRQFLCETRSGCGNCSSCRNLQDNKHPDYIRFPEERALIGSPKNPEPFSIRWLLQTRLPFAPFSSSARFVLFPQGETIQHEAETALLKTLEEMPRHTRFIIVTKNLAALKPAIISRGICVPFHLLPNDTIREITPFQDIMELQCLGGSLDRVSFLHSKFYETVKNRISESLKHPIELISLEKWLLQFHDSKNILREIKTELSYSEILDFFSLVLLMLVKSLPDCRKLVRAVFQFKQDLRMKNQKNSLLPYLVSRLFAQIHILHFKKESL